MYRSQVIFPTSMVVRARAAETTSTANIEPSRGGFNSDIFSPSRLFAGTENEADDFIPAFGYVDLDQPIFGFALLPKSRVPEEPASGTSNASNLAALLS